MVLLRDTGRTVADPREDVRGRTVVDSDGAKIGTVDDLLVDAEATAVRMLRVEHGGILGFGATPSFIPVDAVREVTAEQVCIDESAERIAAAPRYDPDLAEQDYYGGLYGYYGFAPFRSPVAMPVPRWDAGTGRTTPPAR